MKYGKFPRNMKYGMENAVLEPGVTQLLSELYGKYYLVVLTNNSVEGK